MTGGPGDQRLRVGVEGVEGVHLVRVGVAQDLHQRGATTGVRGEDETTAASSDPGCGGHPSQRVVDERVHRSAPGQLGEAVPPAGPAAEEVAPRQHEQRGHPPAQDRRVVGIGEVEAADRHHVPRQLHVRAARREAVQVDDHVDGARRWQRVPGEHQVRMGADVPAQLRQPVDHQPSAGR